jgi:hypothetical protein
MSGSNLPRDNELRSRERALADLIDRRRNGAFLSSSDRLALDGMIRGLEAEIAIARRGRLSIA